MLREIEIETLPELVRILMFERKKTIRGLAEELGIDQSVLWRFIHGKKVDHTHFIPILLWADISMAELKSFYGGKDGSKRDN